MNKKVSVNTVQKLKNNGEKISVLTAYDYSTAKYIDEAGIDIILIGDSLAMTALGYETTNSIGADEMEIFTKAVAKIIAIKEPGTFVVIFGHKKQIAKAMMPIMTAYKFVVSKDFAYKVTLPIASAGSFAPMN